MLAEYKKDSALKEFTELSSELERGRRLHATIQKEAAQRLPVYDQSPCGTAVGMSNAEVR